MLGFGLAALLVLPEPGTIDQPDRQHVAYSYRGIQADSPVPPVPTDGIDIIVPALERDVWVLALDRDIVVPAAERDIWVLPKE